MSDEVKPVIKATNLPVPYKEAFPAERPVVHSAACVCEDCRPQPAIVVPDKHLVFVYGSLKKGFFNHDSFLGSSRQLAADVWVDDYALAHLGHFPAMFKMNNMRVRGEVYEVSSSTLKRLDNLEGINSGFYTRIRVEVKESPTCKYYCYTYIQNPPTDRYKRLMSGIWTGPQSPVIEAGFHHPYKKVETAYPAYVPPAVVRPGPLLFGEILIDTHAYSNEVPF